MEIDKRAQLNKVGRKEQKWTEKGGWAYMGK